MPKPWVPKPGELVHVWSPAGVGHREFSRVFNYLGPRLDGGYKLQDEHGYFGWDYTDRCYRLTKEQEAEWRLTGKLPKRRVRRARKKRQESV